MWIRLCQTITCKVKNTIIFTIIYYHKIVNITQRDSLLKLKNYCTNCTQFYREVHSQWGSAVPFIQRLSVKRSCFEWIYCHPPPPPTSATLDTMDTDSPRCWQLGISESFLYVIPKNRKCSLCWYRCFPWVLLLNKVGTAQLDFPSYRKNSKSHPNSNQATQYTRGWGTIVI